MASHRNYRAQLEDLKRSGISKGTMPFGVANSRRGTLNRRNIRSELILESLLIKAGAGRSYRRNESVLASFIGDFVFPRKGIIIEADGGYHLSEEQIKYDNWRDETITRAGWLVYRFKYPYHISVLGALKEVLSQNPSLTLGGAKSLRIKRAAEQLKK